MDDNEIKYFVESALLAAGRPLSIDQIQRLFDDNSAPEKTQIREAIGHLQEDYEPRGLTITEVASGFRVQIESDMVERLQKLWEERPPRYSRALFETLALIAYRQPMTRGEIEEIRGVAVSSNIIRSLLERDWIRVVGHRDVPGRPAMFGTTKIFLDYFGLKKLEDLPPLADLSDWESLRVQLNLPAVDDDGSGEDLPEFAEIGGLPAVEPESDEDEESAGIEDPPGEDDDAEVIEDDDTYPDDSASSADEDFEPIEATEWPDPNPVRAQILSAQDDEAEHAEDREDAEASLTGA